MKPVVQWLKNHAFIVIFSVVIVGSLASVPFLASSMNAAVREDVNARAQKLNQLRQLERTQIPLPGQPDAGTQGVVNPQLLSDYRESVDAAQQDAQRVYEIALDFNQKEHDVLVPELFPEPPADQRDTMPQDFYEQLMQAYDDLLEEINAGTPLDPAVLIEDLRRAEVQFRTQFLNREADDPLNEEERAELESQLRSLRLQRCAEAAESIGLYLERGTLNLPQWNFQPLPELFEWQYRYWIHSDVLRALHRANRDEGSVLNAPVKRVLTFQLSSPPAAQSSPSTGGGGGSRGGPVGGPIVIGPGPGDSGGRTNQSMALNTNPPADPNAQIQLDYSVSFTGRKSNDLYDVRYVELSIVVDSERVPEVIDALAAQNFITVIGMNLAPADPYAAARNGYVYGDDPVVTLSLQLELIYLRSWMASHFPKT